MFEYGKWDVPEDAATAYEKVKSGEWSQERFEAWVYHVRCVEYREGANGY